MGTRRTLVAAMAAVALLATACGDDDDGTTAPQTTASGGASTTAAATSAPTTAEPTPEDDYCTEERKGGTLTVGEPAYASGLDPGQTTGAAGTTGGLQMTALFDTLMRWNGAEGVYEPQVAESLEPNADASVWTLKLRPNVKFGNGDPLDSAAVIASIERLGTTRVSGGSFVSFITNMEPVDPLTVRFTLNSPWGDFPYFLAAVGGMIVNVKVLNSMTPEQFNLNPAGAGVGPYELERFAPQEEVILRAKDDYWGGPVCIERIRIIRPQGHQALYDALKLGEIDLTLFAGNPVFTRRVIDEGFPGFGEVSQALQLMINTRPGQPGENVDIRRAIAAAIDIDLINQRVYDGTGNFATTIVPPDSPLATPGVEGTKYDPELAKRLVAEAKAQGWDGKILLNYGETSAEEALAVEALLKAAGMDPQVTLLATADLVNRVINEKNFQVTSWSLNVLPGAPWSGIDRNLNSQSPTNRTAFADPDFDAGLAKLRAASTTEAKAAAIAELQRVWNDKVPGVLMRQDLERLTWNENVHGVKPTREAVAMLDKAWIEQ